jgi:hypothetical protein
LCLLLQHKATKCSDHRTVSLIAHTAKTLARKTKRRIERKGKLRMCLGKISLDSEEEKKLGMQFGRNSNADYNIKTTLDINEELYAFFIDW